MTAASPVVPSRSARFCPDREVEALPFLVSHVRRGDRDVAAHLDAEPQGGLLRAVSRRRLGGAGGGYTSGRKKIIDLLRQRSRPYLFSNSVAPAVVGASFKVLDLLESGDDLRARLRDNTAWFREHMTGLGSEVLAGDHPIVPVMIGDAARATQMADLLLDKGVYVIGFSYPIVPVGKARIRTQVSAAHSRHDLQTAATAFAAVRDQMARSCTRRSRRHAATVRSYA